MRARAVYVHVAVYVCILHVHVLPAHVFVFVPVPVPMFERVWLPLVRIHSLRTVLTDRPRTVQLLHKMKIRAAQMSAGSQLVGKQNPGLLCGHVSVNVSMGHVYFNIL